MFIQFTYPSALRSIKGCHFTHESLTLEAWMFTWCPQRRTGRCGVLAIATWAAWFWAAQGRLLTKKKKERKGRKGRFNIFATAGLRTQSVPGCPPLCNSTTLGIGWSFIMTIPKMRDERYTSCIKMIGIGMCDILWKILKILTIL